MTGMTLSGWSKALTTVTQSFHDISGLSLALIQTIVDSCINRAIVHTLLCLIVILGFIKSLLFSVHK